MAYSEKVIDHYENPRNVGSFDKEDPSVGSGMVGAPACGDVMRLQIKVSPEGIIEDAKFKTYGCGSAIASSSLVTEWVKGKSIDDAAAIKNAEIAEELELPPVKVHCSILAEDAIKAAVADYKKKKKKKNWLTCIKKKLVGNNVSVKMLFTLELGSWLSFSLPSILASLFPNYRKGIEVRRYKNS